VNSPGDELRLLRERAYGPGADIHDDPVALARLRELEEAGARTDAAPSEPAGSEPPFSEPTSPDPASPEPAASAAAEADEPVEVEPADPGGIPPDLAEADPPARRAPISRRLAWLWAASVVVALVVGAAITMATSSLGGNRVARLAETDVSEWPTETFGDPLEGARVFEAFDGIRVLVVPNLWGTPAAAITCIFVVRAEEDEESAQQPGEILTTGCGGGAFAPAASFAVTEESPDPLREHYAVGTGVRVVVEGDEAHVFVRTP
jgi:hypothetical protein